MRSYGRAGAGKNHRRRLNHILLEVIVQTLADAREAAAGGADRLEIVRNILDGGLTPPLSLVEAIAGEIRLPLRVMVRENAGYAIRPGELPALQKAVRDFASLGVDGVVLGFSCEHTLALNDLTRVLNGARDVRATFHRAFDDLSDPLSAIDVLAEIPAIDRILTNGGGGSPALRAERLRQFVTKADGRIEIMAGGGVDEEAFAWFARARCVREIHVGRAARDGINPEAPVSAARVRRLRQLAPVS
jgi:copper homeostasis protein